MLFYAVATVLAGIAVLLDSAILVVGAMIVGPEYIAVAIVCTWGLTGAGPVQQSLLLRERPQTGFIYTPYALSFVVAFLAGLAGMLVLFDRRRVETRVGSARV